MTPYTIPKMPTTFPEIMALYTATKVKAEEFRKAQDASNHDLANAFVMKLENEIFRWTCPDGSGDYTKLITSTEH